MTTKVVDFTTIGHKLQKSSDFENHYICSCGRWEYWSANPTNPITRKDARRNHNLHKAMVETSHA